MSGLMKRYVIAPLLTILLVASSAMAESEPESPKVSGPDFGVALTPAVYFVNFLFMYWGNPRNAALMPAYRAPIPSQLVTCLLKHPEGCRYADYRKYFNAQNDCADDAGGGKCRWTSQCQVQPSFERLAPPDFDISQQINQPLGKVRAARLARKLSLDEDIVLTPREYRCLIGTPGDRLPAQRTINTCIGNLTNSNGAAAVPLSSYGLTLDDPLRPRDSLVRSVCAPHAACLRMNQVIAGGALQRIAQKCGFTNKLRRLFTETPLARFSERGFDCQSSSITNTDGACLAETIRRSRQP